MPATPPEVLTLAKTPPHAVAVRATALVFHDPASRALSDRIARIAPSDATVLILGETGTGKELVARDVHARSRRSDKPFVAVNCAALAEHIIESELFGHEKGAFTGALSQKRGWFEAASGGTLFLDEVGDLPLQMQVKLLRVLQEREVNRVGSRVPIPIDVRIIAATNANLEADVAAGRFREDLYFRLNVARLELLPLRQRPGDILPLARHFLKSYAGQFGRQVGFSKSAEAALEAHGWPGNIRELENVVQHALLMADGVHIEPHDLNLVRLRLVKPEPHQPSPPMDLGEGALLEHAFNHLLDERRGDLHARVEERLMRHALTLSNNNQVQAAQLLGISRNVLRHRMKQLGLLQAGKDLP